MSETIWKTEIATALCSYISSIVKTTRDGVLISVPAIPREPEQEFKEEQFPLVSITSLYETFSRERYVQDKQVVSKVNGIAIYEDSCKPFELFYQIDFWSSYQIEMDEMTMLWSSRSFPDFNLPVKDKSGNQRSVYALARSNMQANDFISGTNRTFHSFITYRFSVSIDENIKSTAPIVLEVDNKISINVSSN
jgi:hypothetical protein